MEPTAVDALVAGVAQGLAALPGLSRSGLTVAALLGRRVERGEALVLSYLMSIPASLGAGLFAIVDGGAASTWPTLAAAAVACGVGLATIRAVLAFAQRVNLGGFVIAAGASDAGGGGVAGAGVERGRPRAGLKPAPTQEPRRKGGARNDIELGSFPYSAASKKRRGLFTMMLSTSSWVAPSSSSRGSTLRVMNR